MKHFSFFAVCVYVCIFFPLMLRVVLLCNSLVMEEGSEHVHPCTTAKPAGVRVSDSLLCAWTGKPLPFQTLIFEQDILGHQVAHSFQLFWPKLHFIFPASHKMERDNVFEEKQKYHCLKHRNTEPNPWAFFLALPTAGPLPLACSGLSWGKHVLWCCGDGIVALRRVRSQVLGLQDVSRLPRPMWRMVQNRGIVLWRGHPKPHVLSVLVSRASEHVLCSCGKGQMTVQMDQ